MEELSLGLDCCLIGPLLLGQPDVWLQRLPVDGRGFEHRLPDHRFHSLERFDGEMRATQVFVGIVLLQVGPGNENQELSTCKE